MYIYPFALNDPSGSVKTVAALQLAEVMCAKREKQLGRLKVMIQTKEIAGVCYHQLSSFDPRHVIGCYSGTIHLGQLVIGCYVKVPQWDTCDDSSADNEASAQIVTEI